MRARNCMYLFLCIIALHVERVRARYLTKEATEVAADNRRSGVEDVVAVNGSEAAEEKKVVAISRLGLFESLLESRHQEAPQVGPTQQTELLPQPPKRPPRKRDAKKDEEHSTKLQQESASQQLGPEQQTQLQQEPTTQQEEAEQQTQLQQVLASQQKEAKQQKQLQQESASQQTQLQQEPASQQEEAEKSNQLQQESASQQLKPEQQTQLQQESASQEHKPEQQTQLQQESASQQLNPEKPKELPQEQAPQQPSPMPPVVQQDAESKFDSDIDVPTQNAGLQAPIEETPPADAEKKDMPSTLPRVPRVKRERKRLQRRQRQQQQQRRQRRQRRQKHRRRPVRRRRAHRSMESSVPEAVSQPKPGGMSGVTEAVSQPKPGGMSGVTEAVLQPKPVGMSGVTEAALQPKPVGMTGVQPGAADRYTVVIIKNSAPPPGTTNPTETTAPAEITSPTGITAPVWAASPTGITATSGITAVDGTEVSLRQSAFPRPTHLGTSHDIASDGMFPPAADVTPRATIIDDESSAPSEEDGQIESGEKLFSVHSASGEENDAPSTTGVAHDDGGSAPKHSRKPVHLQRDKSDKPLTKPTVAGADTSSPRGNSSDSSSSSSSSSSSLTDRAVADLIALGSGTGAKFGHGIQLDRDLMKRMNAQDVAVVFLLVIVYYVALVFGWMMIYRMAHNNSLARYYADSPTHSMFVTSQSEQDFFQTFAAAPNAVMLRITGFSPEAARRSSHHTSPHAAGQNYAERMRGADPLFGTEASDAFGGHGVAGMSRAQAWWRGATYQPDFSFVLDLQNWVFLDTIEDRGDIREFLLSNELRHLSISKETRWEDWEELATNVKKKLRSLGYTGITACDFVGNDVVNVYRNEPWANFVYNRATRSLCTLSIIGLFIYFPYMHFKSKTMRAKCKYQVRIGIEEFWQIVESRLSATAGFNR